MNVFNSSRVPIFVFPIVSILSIGCLSPSAASNEAASEHREQAPNNEAVPPHPLTGVDDARENPEEASDMDRPLSELFQATCEHGMKTFECDECRYEVGVTKAVPELFKGGLLKTERVATRSMGLPLNLTGEAAFDERRVAHVSTLSDGIIKKVHVTLGDTVQAGQALIEISSATVGEFEAEYLTADGLYRLAVQDRDRIASLREEGIAAEKELLAADQAMAAARIRKEAALGRLTRLGMSVGKTRSLTENRAKGRLILRAPSAGTVLAMHAVAGETARSETALITIGDNTSMWVWADLYEENIQEVIAAQSQAPLSASISVKAFPNKTFPGTVDFVSPSMSESSRTVKVRVAVPNPERLLLAGMFVKVEIPLSTAEVLTVPSSAVSRDEGRSFVFIHYKGDYFVRRPVHSGRVSEGFTEIVSGLKGAETVVSEGAFLLKSDVLRSKMGAGCAD